MTSSRIPVPAAPADIQVFAANFLATNGVPPLAGGETALANPAAPAQATPPPAEGAPAAPAGEPAAPAAGQPAAPQTGAPQQPGTPAAPGQEGEPQAAGEQPGWVNTLLERMDEIAPPAGGDPLAAELFGFDAPQQPGQQQPGQGLTPEQLAQAQALGLLPQGGAQLPGQPQAPFGVQPQQQGLGGQPPVLPGAPGQPQDEGTLVRNFIHQQAAEAAARQVREEVQPFLRQQEQQRRRQEAIALTDDYPELRDKSFANSLVTRARQWGQQIGVGEQAAGEPGFLELVLLASKQLDVASREGGGQGQPGQPGNEVPIEQPGGANPGALTTDTQQLAQRIRDASPARGLSPVWI